MNISKSLKLERPLTGVRLCNGEAKEQRREDPTEVANRGRRKDLEAALQEGFEAGKKDAEGRLNPRLEALKKERDNLIQAAAGYEEELIRQVETALPDLILDGIRQVLAGWEPEREWVEQIVMEMLQNLKGEDGPFTVYLSPQARTRLMAHHDNSEARFPGIDFREDPKLRNGECYIESRFGMTDGRYEAKIQNLGKALW